MRLPLLAVALSLCVFGLVPALCRAADPENPFKKAAVGDWASYKVTEESGGRTQEVIVRRTVSAKDEKEVTLKVTVTVNDQVMRGADMKIDLTKAFDPTRFYHLSEGVQKEVKNVDDGKETVTIGKKEYECNWTTITVTAKNPTKNAEVRFDYKVWVNADVPLGGVVKMEMKSNAMNRTMILHESGKGK
jgi:hypothetical protein